MYHSKTEAVSEQRSDRRLFLPDQPTTVRLSTLLPAPNMEAGTEEGAVTEGHLRATLRFDNGLVTLNVTAAELKGLLEHGVSETAEGATPGKFPQLAGMKNGFQCIQTSRPAALLPWMF